jgi:hypothetical protein
MNTVNTVNEHRDMHAMDSYHGMSVKIYRRFIDLFQSVGSELMIGLLSSTLFSSCRRWVSGVPTVDFSLETWCVSRTDETEEAVGVLQRNRGVSMWSVAANT